MLTPQEVSSHAFPKAVMGGYSMGAVDEFLDQLTDDYSALYKENAALKAKLKVLVEKVEDYRATEDSMRATLLTAQKMADSIVKEAEQKRTEMLAQTEAEARTRVDQLQNEAVATQERLKFGRQQLCDFITAARAACAKELAFLDQLPQSPVEGPAKEGPPAAEIEESVMATFAGGIEEQPAKEEKSSAVEPEMLETAAEMEPAEAFPEGDPFASETRDNDPTRRIDLSELRFGRNYAGGRGTSH